MQVKNDIQTGPAAEIKIVPMWAWVLAGLAWASAQIFFNIFLSFQVDAPPVWARVLFGLMAGTVVAAYFLLVGYVNRDARRRGMSSVLWTLVAVLIPNGLGILLYFILRQPRNTACPQCGNAVQTGFNFCPRCSCKLSSSCPQCQRAVGVNDVFCPYCGATLRAQATADYAVQPEVFK